MPISKWVDQKTVVYLHDEILCCRKKEEAPTFRNTLGGTGEHYAKWNKPGSERQILYDLTYKWNLINKTNKQQNIARDSEIKNKVRGEVERDIG